MNMKYIHEQKLQYLRNDYEFVRSGGFYRKHTAKIGVSRATYDQWVLRHADKAGRIG